MPLEEVMPILNIRRRRRIHGCSVFHVGDIAKCSGFTSEGKIKGDHWKSTGATGGGKWTADQH